MSKLKGKFGEKIKAVTSDGRSVTFMVRRLKSDEEDDISVEVLSDEDDDTGEITVKLKENENCRKLTIRIIRNEDHIWKGSPKTTKQSKTRHSKNIQESTNNVEESCCFKFLEDTINYEDVTSKKLSYHTFHSESNDNKRFAGDFNNQEMLAFRNDKGCNVELSDSDDETLDNFDQEDGESYFSIDCAESINAKNQKSEEYNEHEDKISFETSDAEGREQVFVTKNDSKCENTNLVTVKQEAVEPEPYQRLHFEDSANTRISDPVVDKQFQIIYGDYNRNQAFVAEIKQEVDETVQGLIDWPSVSLTGIHRSANDKIIGQNEENSGDSVNKSVDFKDKTNDKRMNPKTRKRGSSAGRVNRYRQKVKENDDLHAAYLLKKKMQDKLYRERLKARRKTDRLFDEQYKLKERVRKRKYRHKHK